MRQLITDSFFIQTETAYEDCVARKMKKQIECEEEHLINTSSMHTDHDLWEEKETEAASGDERRGENPLCDPYLSSQRTEFFFCRLLTDYFITASRISPQQRDTLLSSVFH